MVWQTPKTNWNDKDAVRPSDMNRIEGNILELKKAATIDIADTAGNFAATNVEDALQELGGNVKNGKTSIANAITAMGQSASGGDTFDTLAAKIRDISKDATAVEANVLSGKTFYAGGVRKTGTMPNRGAVVITPSTSNQTIQAGYHNGQGYVKGDLGYILSKPEILTSTERQDVLNTYAGHIKDSIHAMRMVMNSDLWLDDLLASSTIFGKYLTEPSIQAMTETTKALQKIGHNQARLNQILGNSAAFSLFKNHSWQGRVWFMNGPVGYIPMVRGYSWNTEGEYLGDAESPSIPYMGTVAWPQRTGDFTLIHTFSIVQASAHQNECALVSDFAIDLTNVSEIVLYYFAPASDRATELSLIVGTQKRVSYTSYTVRAVHSSNSEIFNGSLSLDVSGLAGAYYVRVHNKNHSSTGFRVVYPTRIGLV